MAWQTAWNFTPDHGWSDTSEMNVRNIIPANYSSYSGIKVRLTAQAGSGGTFAIGGTSIGIMSANDDFDSAPTRITWDTGSNTTTISASQNKTSDEITFDFDKTKRYGIHVYMASRNNGRYIDPGLTNEYYDYNGDETMIQSISGTPGDYNGGVYKLEVYEEEADNIALIWTR